MADIVPASAAARGDEALKIEAVVVAYNAPAELENCVESLRRSDGLDVRLIVVNNGDEAGVSALVRSLATCVPAGQNLGYGGALNLGLRHALTDWVAFANQDLVVEPSCLAGLISAVLEHERTLGRTAVAGPRLLNVAGIGIGSGHRVPRARQEIIELLVGEAPAGMRRMTVDSSVPQICGWVPGALLLGRRRTFESINGFDPSYFMYVEDVDLFDRLRRRGVDCLWVPSVSVIHTGGRRPISASLQAEALLNWARFYRDRNGRGVGTAVLIAGLVGSYVRGAVWLTRFLLGSRRSEAAAYAKMFGLAPLFVLRRLVRR